MDKSTSQKIVDIVIKFGGSAITNKDSLETLRPEALASAADCIRQCIDVGLTCIVVHGAGSFGHHQARKYQVNSGLVTTNTHEERREKLWGYCLTRQSVTKLNQMVVNSLIDVGIPAIACSPGSSWETKGRHPVKWSNYTVQGLLEQGLVPVLHGDCVLDNELGCCILSGDTVIKTFCSFFEVKRVVFLTDVDGIYDKPPDEPGAKLLKTISVNQDGSVSDLISTSLSKHDSTGGIMLKLKTAIDIVVQTKGRCLVHVCAVGSPEAIHVSLGHEDYMDSNFTTISLRK